MTEYYKGRIYPGSVPEFRMFQKTDGIMEMQVRYRNDRMGYLGKWMPVNTGFNTPNPIKDYNGDVVSAGVGNIDVINVTDGGSGYDPANATISITITGDGKDAEAIPRINTHSNTLTNIIVTNKGYNYSRDESNGFMAFIEDIAKSRCGVKTKDNWDPADIYMVKANKEKNIRKKLDEITQSDDEMANIYSLNAYMRELIQSKDLVPVSLKAISKIRILRQ